MARYWTRPQPVEAVQWTPALGPLSGTTGVGCAVCGPGMTGSGYQGAPQTCLSIAAHDPIRHPHHLLVPVDGETLALFSGWWLVTHQDGTREVCAPDAFAQRFSMQSDRKTLERLLGVLGPPCEAMLAGSCDGCAYEMQEAWDILRGALGVKP